MANKTAMQHLIAKILRMPESNIKAFLGISGAAYIEEEKKQIIDAYEYGYWRGNNEDECEPEQYYENPYCDPNNKKYENNN